MSEFSADQYFEGGDFTPVADETREQQIAVRLAAATPGPWRWRIRPRERTTELRSGSTSGPIVMAFKRWGMDAATPTFREVGSDGGWGPLVSLHELHDDPPDAELIANAPADLAYLLEEVGRLREALRRTDALMWEWGGDTGHDEEPDGTWRPPSVRERHRLNAELLNEGAALAREDGT